VIPLSFLRRLDSLRYTSFIALISIAYLVVLVVYHYASGDTLAERGEVHWLKWQGIVPTLASFPVIVFAYTCHQNVNEHSNLYSKYAADANVDVLYSE
jgi:amino acid permease